MLQIYIVIPAHNEEKYILQTLQSLCAQTLRAKKIVVVDDHSTDKTTSLVTEFAKQYPSVELVQTISSHSHLPGSKVIKAFYAGYETLDEQYDILCKFDADLLFPEDYLERIATLFKNNFNCGIAGGVCTVKKNNKWITEKLTSKDHVRGALKAYSKNCFQKIGKLKPSMGWDTVDELLARYHGFSVEVDTNLHVKHLKPTGIIYDKSARYKQGQAFYKLRYGLLLTVIASAKLAFLKKKPFLFFDYVRGFLKAKNAKVTFLVNEKEGIFIRQLRWKTIKKKLF